MMTAEIVYTDEFGARRDELTEPEQTSVKASVDLLERVGVLLGFPHSSDIRGAEKLRELRIQRRGKPLECCRRSTQREMRYFSSAEIKQEKTVGTNKTFPSRRKYSPSTLKNPGSKGLFRVKTYGKWSDLRAKMSPEAQAQAAELTAQMIAEMPLEHLRADRQLTQTNLAQVLGVNQSAVSKLEKRTDMYLSTLRSYIQAMGGLLEIQAVFPEGTVRIEMLTEKQIEPSSV